MKIKNFTKEEQEKIMGNYARLALANLTKNIVQDLINNRNESVIYKKYTKQRIVDMLENPQRNEEDIRQLSGFIYLISPHYRRLVDYYSTILLYNYNIIPNKLTTKKIDKKKYTESYYHIVNECDKYNLKHEATKALKIAVRDGVYYGICYESEDSFYIKQFVATKYAKISSVVDGVYRFSIDMAYFNGKEDLLDNYGADVKRNYYLWKGDKQKGTQGDKSKKWYEIPNGIVIKADETDPIYSFPVFMGLLLDILSIDDFKLLQKAKAEGDNYKVLSARIETDENGVPKLDYELAQKYYEQMASNLPPGIGLLLSPFTVEEFSFQTSAAADRNNVTESINTFWQGAGSPSSLFGGGNISSSSAMMLAVKPDESFAFSILLQFQRYFNMRIKKMNLPYSFKIKFLEESIFNQDEVTNRLFKAASYGISMKTEYASALNITPSDMWGLTYLEEEILELSNKVWTTPLVSSSTQSSVGDEGGRPTAKETGGQLTESGEKTRETDANDR